MTKSRRSSHPTGYPLKPYPRPELVFGLVGPLGIDLELMVQVLKESLAEVGYGTTRTIRLSRLLGDLKGLTTRLHKGPEEDERIATHMTAGTELRERTGWGGRWRFLASRPSEKSERT